MKKLITALSLLFISTTLAYCGIVHGPIIHSVDENGCYPIENDMSLKCKFDNKD